MKLPAIIITRFPYESSWGGEESHTLTLGKYFRDKGFEVIFLGSCPILLQKFSEQGFRVKKAWGGRMVVTPFELLKSFFLFPFIKWNLSRHFKNLSQEFEIKALYCLSLNEKLLLSPESLKHQIPVTWVEHQQIRNWLVKNPWKKLYKDLSSFVKIVPISKANKNRLISEIGVPEKNIQVITNGVDIESLALYERKTQKNLIVCANRFIPKKGVMDFLATLPDLFKRHNTLQVVLIGEGEEKRIIEDFIKKNLSNKSIQLLQFLKKENWYELLSKCDIFVSSARDANETFSLSTAEALALGCKVVVTKCSGIADALDDGRNAFLAQPKNSEDLKTQIERAMTSDEVIREYAKKTAREKFNQKTMLTEYESVIIRT